MTRVWFKGLFWCPKHEQSVLLLYDEAGRPLLRIQISPQHRELVMDEINRAQSDCCAGQRLLLSFLASQQLEVESLVFQEVNGFGGARINLRGKNPTSLCTDDPVAALVLAVSLGVPMYLSSACYTTFLNLTERHNGKESAQGPLPEAFSRFLQDSAILHQLDSPGQEPGV